MHSTKPCRLQVKTQTCPTARTSPPCAFRTPLPENSASFSLSHTRTRTHPKSLAHLAPVPLWIQIRAGPEILRLELMREEGCHCQPPCHRALSLRSCNVTTSCLCPDSKSSRWFPFLSSSLVWKLDSAGSSTGSLHSGQPLGRNLETDATQGWEPHTPFSSL